MALALLLACALTSQELFAEGGGKCVPFVQIPQGKPITFMSPNLHFFLHSFTIYVLHLFFQVPDQHWALKTRAAPGREYPRLVGLTLTNTRPTL